MFSNSLVVVPTHPLLGCTICFIGGTLSAFYHISIYYTFGIIAVILLFSVYLYSKSSSRHLLIIITMGISFLTGTWRYNHLQLNYQKTLKALPTRPFNCIGRVIDIQKHAKKAFKTVITLKIYSIEQEDVLKPIAATIQLHLITRPRFLVGDTIKVHLLTIKQSKNDAYNNYLCKEGIIGTIFMPNLNYTHLARPKVSVSRFLHTTRSRLETTFTRKLSPLAHALISALFLGLRPQNNSYALLKKQCSFWGIVHYLARSGLHVVLILAAWNALLRIFVINYFIKQLILLLFILVYHILTQTSISFLRALITFVLYKIYLFQSLSFRTLHVLSLTTYLVLLYNPLQLFFLDFQLSFGLTFALAWFNEVSIKIQRLYKIIENK